MKFNQKKLFTIPMLGVVSLYLMSTMTLANELESDKEKQNTFSINETTIDIHGYIKVDLLYDLKQQSGDRINYGSIKSSNESQFNSGHVRIHARESRFNITAKQSFRNQVIKGFLEGDFYGDNGSENISNSSSFRIRHAYIAFGNWVVGQTWSNYIDVKSFPENLDFSNETGQSFIRQGQIKYQHAFGNTSISYSIENPETDVLTITDGVIIAAETDTMFDLTAKIKQQSSWGHASLQAVIRKNKIYLNDDSSQDNLWGYGIGTAGELKLTSDDSLKFHFSYGSGIGRYIQEANGLSAIALHDDENTLSTKLLKTYGGYLGYQHIINPTIRANFNMGFLETDIDNILTDSKYDDLTGSSYTKNIYSLHTNVIWSVIPSIDVGIEFSTAIRETLDDERSEIQRIQMSAKYRF